MQKKVEGTFARLTLLLAKLGIQISVDFKRKCWWCVERRNKWTFRCWMLESINMEPFVELG